MITSFRCRWGLDAIADGGHDALDEPIQVQVESRPGYAPHAFGIGQSQPLLQPIYGIGAAENWRVSRYEYELVLIASDVN